MERLKKTIKRVAALAGGALMVGAAMAGALAQIQDLPHPMVDSNGNLDAFLVVGTMGWNPNLAFNAAAATGLAHDLAIGIDVGTAFGQTATAGVTTGTGVAYEGGALFELGGEKLVLFEDPTVIKNTFTSNDFDWLAGGTYQSTAGKSGGYSEYLTLSAASSMVKYVKPTSANEPGLYLDTISGTPFYTYKALFSTPLSWSGGATDLISSSIDLFGQPWLITSFDSTLCTWIELMGGKNTVTVTTDTPVSTVIDGVTYDIALQTVAATAPGAGSYVCTYDINGNTVQLSPGQQTILGDVTIGATKCLQAKAGVADTGTIFIGAQKMKITNGGTVQVDDQSVSGSTGMFTANCVGQTWSGVGFSYGPNTERWDAEGTTFTDPISGAFGFVFEGMDPVIGSSAREQITTTISGQNVILGCKTMAGPLTTEIFWDDNGAPAALPDSGCGKYTGGTDPFFQLWISEAALAGSTGMALNDRVILSSDPFSHVVSYDSYDAINGQVQFTDIASGKSSTITFDTVKNAACVVGAFTVNSGTYILDGLSYLFCEDGAGNVIFDTNAGTNFADAGPTPIFTDKGAKITLVCPAGATTNPGTVLFFEEKNKGVAADYTNWAQWNYAWVPANSAFDFTAPVWTNLGAVGTYGSGTVGTSTTSKLMSQHGTVYTWDTSSEQVSVDYPDTYATADLWLVPTGAEKTAVMTDAVDVKEFSGATGFARTDADIGTPSKNVILMAGPNVNQKVKELADAGKTWTAEEWADKADTGIVQYVENAFGDHDALIIAGYEWKDTELAGKVLTSFLLQGSYASQMTGDLVEINTAGATSVGQVTFV